MLPLLQPLLQAWRFLLEERGLCDATSEEAQALCFRLYHVGLLARTEHVPHPAIAGRVR